ncbi:MAG: potassium transporter TrkH [Candidatus Atribacteria bacterium]|nr:potassium transporter TrkH [Candidatus Atribacteria bacterium]MBN2747537.1 hypothetical protein [Bacteroidales bacterium]
MKRFVIHLFVEKLLTFGYFSKIPQRQLMHGFLSYMLLGTILLCLPISQKHYVSIVDNLFTSVSAVSTTGLATVDIAESYSLFGQIVILFFIQMGGLGYMTLSSFLMLKISRHLNSNGYLVLKTEFSIPQEFLLPTLLNRIVIFTFVFELLGAVGLSFIFYNNNIANPIWNGIFHSISAFCTAGFSLFQDSFMSLNLNGSINLIISILSLAGGLGFIFLFDIWEKIVNQSHKTTFTTKVIFAISLLVLLFGTFQLFIFEPTIQYMDDYSKLTVSFFQAMTAMSTVGFNTIDIGHLHPSSLMMIIFLMFIGASPSGTGGGLKSTSFFAVFAYVKTRLSHGNDVSMFGNIIPKYRYRTALTLFVVYISCALLGTYLLTFSENADLMPILFEAFSAIGTVGLSVGLTGSLTIFGKIIIIILMFIGRVGVLTFGNSILVKHHRILKERDIVI